MRTRWVVAAAAAVLTAGVAAGFWWRSTRSLAKASDTVSMAEAGDTVSMAGGELTFHAPTGWSREECPHADPSCLDVRPPGDGGADRIIVIVQPYQSNAPEGDISLMLLQPGVAPAGSHFTVDGVDFVRIHDSGSASDGTPATMVLGLLPNRDTVRILCEEGDRAELVKAGCDVVIGSLHLRT